MRAARGEDGRVPIRGSSRGREERVSVPMVDIHSHILPGIDDGARSIEDSLALCRIAAEDGITTIVATPHVMEFRYPNTRETIEGPFAQLASALVSEKIPLSLVPGSEVHH